MPGRGEVVQTKDRFSLTVTPAGRYSIYERIGDRDENLYAKLKEKEAKRLWGLIDKVLEEEEGTSHKVSLDDMIRTDALSSIRTRETADRDRELIESMAYNPTIEKDEFEVVENYVPPTTKPMPVEKRKQWAVMASGGVPRELTEVRYSPMDMRGYREVVGWNPSRGIEERY